MLVRQVGAGPSKPPVPPRTRSRFVAGQETSEGGTVHVLHADRTLRW